MSIYSLVKTWYDANVTTNRVAAITGEVMNEGIVTYILKYLTNIAYDTTRPYFVGDVALYDNGTFSALYHCTADQVAGAFDSDKWTREIVRHPVITQTINISETNEVTHYLEEVPFACTVTDSADRVLPVDVVEITNQKVVISSTVEYTNAKIYLIG